MIQNAADDVPMGVPSSDSSSGAKKDDVGGASGLVTYSSAEAGSGIATPFGASPVLPATSSSVLSRAESPGLVNLVISQRNLSAALVLQHERPRKIQIFNAEGAVCIDPAGHQLLMCYVLKLNDTIKWRTKWDKMSPAALAERATKGARP